MRFNLCLARCLSLVGLLNLSVLSHATPKSASPAQVTPQAQALCAQVTAAYRALNSYADWINIFAPQGSGMRGVSLRFHKPNQIFAANSWSQPRIELSSDGTKLITISYKKTKQITRRLAPQGPGFIRRTLALTGAKDIGLVPDLLEGNDFLTLLKQQRLKSLKIGRSTVVRNSGTTQLIATFALNAAGVTTTVYDIGQVDHMLHHASTTAGGHNSHPNFDETHDVQINPTFPATAFVVPPPPIIDSRAMTILHQMAQAYQSLKSYSDTEELKAIIPPSMPDAKYWSDANLEVSLQRPNLAHVIVHTKTGDTNFVSDGKFLFQPLEEAQDRYTKSPAPKDVTAITQILAMAKSDLDFLLTGRDFLNSGSMLLKSLSLGAADTVDGVTVDTILDEENYPTGTSLATFSIGHDDHLLRRLRVVITDNKEPQQIVMTQTCSHVTANPTLPTTTWAFQPPFGAKAVAFNPAYYNSHLNIGIKPFAFKATDLEGQPISLEQYKGKVTQLNFWSLSTSTVQEQAKNSALYQKYHSQGYDIVGIFLGIAPTRGGHWIMGTDNYPPLYNFLQQHPLAWRQVFDGYQWAGDIAQIYGVGTTTPLNILIGRDGRIVALNPSFVDTPHRQDNEIMTISPNNWEQIIQQTLKTTVKESH